MTGETMIGGGGGGDQAETDARNKRPVPDNFDRMSRQQKKNWRVRHWK